MACVFVRACMMQVDQLSDSVWRALSEPFECLRFDFASPSLAHFALADVRCTAGGTACAVLWWWELEMGAGPRLSSAPERYKRRHGADAVGGDREPQPAAARGHWKACLSFLGERRVERAERVWIVAAHSEIAVWFGWGTADTRSAPQQWAEHAPSSLPCARERHQLAHSDEWVRCMRAGAALAAEQSAGTDGACVVVYTADDVLLLRTIVEALTLADHALRILAVLPRAAVARVAASSWLPRSTVTLIGVRGPHEVAPAVAEALPAGCTVTAVLIEPYAPLTNRPHGSRWDPPLSGIHR